MRRFKPKAKQRRARRKGMGKSKGSSFERKVCSRLSLWVTNKKMKDVFWRSSMSGGRATVIRARGGENRQAGDICSVAPEGHVLTDFYFFECKHVRNIGLQAFILSGKGPIAGWWKQACKQAKEHNREPVLIAKGNHMPIIVITHTGSMFNKHPVAFVHGLLKGCAIGLLDRVLKEKFVAPKKHPTLALG